MRKFTVFLMCSLFLVGTIIAGPGSAHALLLTGQDIIAAPASIADDSPGAENIHQQAFNEMQNVNLASVLTNSIKVTMHVSELGDWIRVVTKAAQVRVVTKAAAVVPVPEPATMLLLGMGLFGLAWFNRKKLKI